MRELIDELNDICETEVNMPLSSMTTLRIGGYAKYVVYPNSDIALDGVLRLLKLRNIPFKMIGKGSDLLCSDDDYYGVIIRLDRYLCNAYFDNEHLVAEAGCSIIALSYEAMKNELSGLEFASGIPGTVGGVTFMNAGAYVTGAQLKKLGEYYAKAIHEHYGDDFDVLFGPAYKGIPLSVATTIAFSELYGKEIRYCSNRKEVKDHGDTGILLGSQMKDGDRVVIIEDVTTSGKSIEETFPIIKAQGDVEIIGLMVSLNRMERGLTSNASALDEIQQKYGFGANAIVTMEDVVECLYNKECQGRVLIDDNLKAAIDAYYAEYGVH